MSNLAVCVQDDNKNVTPKETIDAIYKAGFKDVFVQYYHRENIEFDYLGFCCVKTFLKKSHSYEKSYISLRRKRKG